MNDSTPKHADQDKDVYRLIESLEKRIESLENELISYRLMLYGEIVSQPAVPWEITWNTSGKISW